jgi:hypothetical protein
MRRSLLLILFTAVLPGAWDKGFNFRATTDYVQDGENETYVLGTDQYPVTRNGVTFGWASSYYIQARNRNSGVDRRLAGMHVWDTSTDTWSTFFRVNLPATGSYQIRLAAGDHAEPKAHNFPVEDDTTPLFTITGSTAAGHFLDATNTDYTTANWPGSNSLVTKTFSTQSFNLELSLAKYGAIAHISIKQVSTRSRIVIISQNLTPRFLAELLLSRSIR